MKLNVYIIDKGIPKFVATLSPTEIVDIETDTEDASTRIAYYGPNDIWIGLHNHDGGEDKNPDCPSCEETPIELVDQHQPNANPIEAQHRP